ncbi:hypothetical protein D3C87_2109340 [compost metagenome]
MIFRASKVSSGTAMAAASDVSLNSEMTVDESDGSTLRSMSGMMMDVRICIGVRPIASPASGSPLGMDSKPPRKTSAR